MAYNPPAFKNIKESIRLREKTSGHSVFGPSQISRIIECPASFRENLKRPLRPSGPAAVHGTMLHDIMEHILASIEPSTYDCMSKFQRLPEEDQSAVTDCMEFILPLIQGNATVHLEKLVSLKSCGIPQIEGTADVVIRYPKTKEVIVLDWKFGGTPVYVDNNTQLKCYGLGALLELYPDAPSITTIIAQPALNYFQSFKYVSHELLAFQDELKEAIKLALSPDAPYSPQRKACQFCSAKVNCRSRIDKAQEDTKEIFRVVKSVKERVSRTTPSVVPIAELVHVLDRLQEVEAVASDLRKYFHSEVHAGRSVPGYKLVNGRGSRKFLNQSKAFYWLIKHCGVKAPKLYNTKPKSVPQVEKVIGKMKKDPDFKKLYETFPGKPQLVKEDDKREAIKPEGTNVFNDINSYNEA